MVGSQGSLADGDGSAAEQFGLVVSTLGDVDLGQLLRAGGHFHTVGSEGLSRQCQGALQQYPGLLVAVQGAKNTGEAVEVEHDVWVSRLEDRVSDLQCACWEPFGLWVAAKRLLEHSQVAHDPGHVRMHVAEVPRRRAQRFLHQKEGLTVLPLLEEVFGFDAQRRPAFVCGVWIHVRTV
jgi:hypothetical protein